MASACVSGQKRAFDRPSTVTRSARASGTAAPRSSMEHPAMAGRTGAAIAAWRSRLRSKPIGTDRAFLAAAIAVLDAGKFMLASPLARIVGGELSEFRVRLGG